MGIKHGRMKFITACLLGLLVLGGCRQTLDFSAGQEKDSSPESYSSSQVDKEQFGSPEVVEEESIQSISGGNYAYECLGEEGKKAYDQMLNAILNYQESVKLSTTDADLVREAYQAVSSDYGGLFWVDGYVYTSYTRGSELVGLEFSPAYTMERQEKEEAQKQIDAVVEEWLGGISLHDSDYEKAKYVFETLIEKADYVDGALENQNIQSVFLYRQTVCQGYACATQYLLRQLGISSSIVSGWANNQAHAWNMVKLDGEWYHMDTTWGNSTYLDTQRQEAKFVNYNFLCMNDEEIAYTHQIDLPFDMPECTSLENNYYVREGRYFENWEPEAIGAVFREAWDNGLPSISVKCGNSQVYEQIKEYFINQQRIADYCSGMEYVYYMEDQELCVFTVNFN